MPYERVIETLSDLADHWFRDEPWFETRQVAKLLGKSGIFALLKISECTGKRRVGHDDKGYPITLINGQVLVEVWEKAARRDPMEAIAYLHSLEPEKRRRLTGAMYRVVLNDATI